MKSPRMMDALDGIRRTLAEAGVPEPDVQAEWLLAHVLGCSRADLFLRRERFLSSEQRARLAAAVERLERHEPLQYVLGEAAFMDLSLRVDARALIPRPETEELVSHVLEDRGPWELDAPRIADVGTGSGCIVLALIHERPQGRYVATDISGDALMLARENAAALGVESRIEWRCGDLLDGVREASLDVVISNPPYIATADYLRLPPHIRDREPRVALDGGTRGLNVVGRLIRQAYSRLRPAGRLYLEIGADQGEDVGEAMRACGFQAVRILRDRGGRERIVRGNR